ncbi:MAG: hypothetical protein HY961_15850 [Ignavibacteriae bacterium]|nr:hypothetical protein [Ignavibacteriota bacterium]
MNAQQRRTLLGSLAGHLVADSPQQETDIQRLFTSLSRSVLPEDIQQLKATRFAFEGADLFAEENIPQQRISSLQAISERGVAEEAEFRVFVREVPVRSTQLHASLPLWAGGAAVDHTIGPIANADGRLFWFDFFRIEKLVALYVQGNPYPVLLFKIKVGIQFMGANLPLVAELLPTYKLDAGSIWINSQLLAANSPTGNFSGLTIRSGVITLSAPPQLINGKLTISAGTKVTVKLQLQQQAVVGADPTSPYGKDARAMQLNLSRALDFHFTGMNCAFDNVGDASWNVFGHAASFDWNPQGARTYDNLVHRVLIPFTASTETFRVVNNQSPFHTLAGETPIAGSFWALPSAPIDVANPSPAEGIGAMLVIGEEELTASWRGLKGGALNLKKPYIMAAPGRIAVSDLTSGNVFSHQDFEMWKDAQNPFGTSVRAQFLSTAAFFYDTLAGGVELLMTQVNADVRADRPVTVKGEALEIRSKNSLLILAVTNTFRLIYLFDDNILLDTLDLTKQPPTLPKPISLALRNALFKVTPVNGCLLAGLLAEDFVKIERGFLFLTFGMFAYLPTLPDPYAANINRLKFQFRGSRDATLTRGAFGNQSIWLRLVCLVRWEPDVEDNDDVEVSFHFAPLQSQFQLPSPPATVQPLNFSALVSSSDDEAQGYLDKGDTGHPKPLPDYDGIWNESTNRLADDYFALLDVSTNADLLGVSFNVFNNQRMAMVATLAPVGSTGFPLQVQGLDVVSRGMNVKAFTVPQISWEPVINLTPPALPNAGDPDAGINYYPNDGGPTRILNNSGEQIALAPIPLTDFIVEKYADDSNFAALSLFTLPFGMRALALLQRQYVYQGQSRPGANLTINWKNFPNNLKGARQLELDGGEALREGESDMFMGSTVQVNNILNMFGAPTGDSTLGASVTKIYNNEWLMVPFQLIRHRGVPLERIDLSGYGASTFSNWLNPKAAIAETSQAKFDIFVGRCAHEIIQVKTLMEPWKIKVVRTITLFRTASNYVYRYDSGWRPESDGRFDGTYYVYKLENGKLVPKERQASHEIHPGVIKGLFNVKDIRETADILPFTGTMTVQPPDPVINEVGEEILPHPGPTNFNYELQPVFFNADIEIENPVSGFVTKTVDGVEKKLIPSKGILGFVQIAPRGIPITTKALHDLIIRQGGTIGAPIDCVVDVATSGQQMRLSSFDISNSFGSNGSDQIFAVSGRGNVLLPKDGSWSMVKHQFGTGEVSPVPKELAVPLIRIGKLIKQAGQWVLDKNPANELLRVANPTELLRNAVNDTLNYGFLQTTDTQKALFLTPAFKWGTDQLLSKTPPLFADAFRIVSSKAIFPNIGNASTGFGDAISLLKNGNEFVQNVLTDGGKNVLELMKINDTVAAVKQEGYKLLKQIQEFDLPSTEWVLVELGGAFKIYLEYKATKPNQGQKNGKLDFDVNSFANNLGDQWKSRMSNLAVVVDLGPIDRLMSIKGNWDAKKGNEAQYGSDIPGSSFPRPEIEFASELQPVIEILQILQDLQGENYKDAFARGLKLAMSNKAGSWEYKLEASKEIPVIRFPMPMFLYNDPNAPLKLEAGLKLGAYFNAALKVTTDPTQLLPTAGAFLGFYGRLSVMCVSLSVATVYAIGQVNLDIAADTKVGPSLKMKFGFGAQIVVGLPVVGNVSVMYVVGVEIYTDATKVVVSAFLLFQGHAELLAGLVSVTITIEAKGTISRANDRTDMAAQVTFGLDISIFLVINISFSTSWSESRQIA